MGKIVKNGVTYSGSSDNADNVKYNNNVSNLDATNVQEAIDKLDESVDILNSNLGVIGSYYSMYYKPSSISANTLTFKDIYTPPDDGVYLVKVSCEIAGSISSGYFRLGLADGNQTNFPNSNGQYVSAYASIDKKAVSLSLVVFLNSKKSVKLAFEGTKACDLYSSMEVLRIR